MGVEVYRDMRDGLKDVDIVMMLRLQRERMNGAFVPSVREYFRFFGLDAEKLKQAKPDALVMHPGPMNRGVEIDSAIADGPHSLIREQVEMGVAVRMAVLEALAATCRTLHEKLSDFAGKDTPPIDERMAEARAPTSEEGVLVRIARVFRLLSWRLRDRRCRSLAVLALSAFALALASAGSGRRLWLIAVPALARASLWLFEDVSTGRQGRERALEFRVRADRLCLLIAPAGYCAGAFASPYPNFD